MNNISEILLNITFREYVSASHVIFETQKVQCTKSRAFLFMFLSSIVHFSKTLQQNIFYKAENWQITLTTVLDKLLF